jgi:hypothetical protein
LSAESRWSIFEGKIAATGHLTHLLKGGSTMKKVLALLAVSVFAASGAFAAESGLPVPVKTAQGIKFYNGGVGVGERSRMPQLYPLKIVLATDSGLYLNDAQVTIRDRSGTEVLSVRADNGPWLVADVPAGSYTIEAVLEGNSKKASVSVASGKKQTAILTWKTTDIDMGL